MGRLDERIDQLTKLADAHARKLDALGDKVDRLRLWVAAVGGGVTVVGVLVWLITSWRDTIGRWLIGH